MFKASFLFWLCICFGKSWAQAPPTIEHVLQSHHVGVSHTDLVAALHNRDAEVRGLAAMKLASDGDRTAAPAIRDALKLEHNYLERFNMARALNLLGDPDGKDEFTRICSDVTVRQDWRLEAADELAPNVEKECLDSVVSILASSGNPVLTGASLETLLKLNPNARMSQPERAEMAFGLTSALSSSISDVRQKAAECIVVYRVVAAVPALRNAASKETDPTTKGFLKEALHRLATL